MTNYTVEEALRIMEQKAAALRHLAYTSAKDVPPEPEALAGFGEIAEDVMNMARAIREVLDTPALDVHVGSKRRKGGRGSDEVR